MSFTTQEAAIQCLYVANVIPSTHLHGGACGCCSPQSFSHVIPQEKKKSSRVWQLTQCLPVCTQMLNTSTLYILATLPFTFDHLYCRLIGRCANLQDKQTFKVWQPQRAARSKRPKTMQRTVHSNDAASDRGHGKESDGPTTSEGPGWQKSANSMHPSDVQHEPKRGR